MKLCDLDSSELRRRLAGDGLVLETGPFTFALTLRLPELADAILRLYGDFPIGSGTWLDFRLLVRPRRTAVSLGRYAEIFVDGRAVFAPFPRRAAMPNIEWALNWWIYNFAHQFLMIHAGVVAREGAALLLSGIPGSGKSTLCAALAQSGWRLLSDELALLEPGDLNLRATARPIALKNESIEIIRTRIPNAVFGPIAPDTHKGTIAHLKPPLQSVANLSAPARPRWLVFPKYDPAAQTRLEPMPKARAFMELAENAFNYRFRGHSAFEQLGALIDRCACFQLPFSGLEEALAQLDHLCRDSARGAA